MIYFEKNGFQYSTRVSVRKKAFRNKNNGTIRKSRKKSIDIGPWFFFPKTQHTIMSELNRATLMRKRHRARSVVRFCWTLPYIYIIVAAITGYDLRGDGLYACAWLALHVRWSGRDSVVTRA